MGEGKFLIGQMCLPRHLYEDLKNGIFMINEMSEALYASLIKTEMKGFEPLRRESRPTAFRVRTLQPLGYISLF